MTSWSVLFLSIALHLAVWFVVLNHQPAPKKDGTIDVTIVNKPQPPLFNKPFVRRADVKPDLLSPKKNEPKYLSEKDQSVKKEMQVKKSGLTHNESAKKSVRHETPNKELSEQSIHAPTLADLTRTETPDSPASTERFDKVPEGPVTALNTERFMYYNFFSRVEEKVVPLWERNLRDTEGSLGASDLHHMSNRDYITEIDVQITPQGRYITTVLAASSGRPDLDRDAIAAFKEADYFPNPPKEMIQADGKIHLHYDMRFSLGDRFGPGA